MDPILAERQTPSKSAQPEKSQILIIPGYCIPNWFGYLRSDGATADPPQDTLGATGTDG